MRRSLKKIGFFMAFLVPMLTLTGYYLGGLWNFYNVVWIYVLFPLLDTLVGQDKKNLDEAVVSQATEDRFYRFITYGWVYVQTAMLAWGAYVFAFGDLHGFWPCLGFLLGMANITGGIGITVAHELGHKNNSLEQGYAQWLLHQVCYSHFFIEHNAGHHVHVATPLDPATSRKGENVYVFWWRTVTGSWKSAWKIERNRLTKKNIPIFSWENRMLKYPLYSIGILVALVLGTAIISGEVSYWVVVFFFAQSILGFSLLELVNYIEHYGIVRKELSPGRYERVNPRHSWNASELLSNFFLFQLQRHADHHANANRRYQVLRHFEESPQLPAGYPTMIVLALFPPLWFSLMDKRLESWQNDQNADETANFALL